MDSGLNFRLRSSNHSQSLAFCTIIQLNQTLTESRMVGESPKDKMWRKLGDNPWIPVGELLRAFV